MGKDVNTCGAVTLLLIQESIDHNTDFDQFTMPNRNHGAVDPYAIRRVWDHLVRHLLGAELPPPYRLTGRPSN